MSTFSNPVTMNDPTGMRGKRATGTDPWLEYLIELALWEAAVEADEAAYAAWEADRDEFLASAYDEWEKKVLDPWLTRFGSDPRSNSDPPRYEAPTYSEPPPEPTAGTRPKPSPAALMASEETAASGKETPGVVWQCGWVPAVVNRARDCPDYNPSDPRTMPTPFPASLANDLRWEQDKHRSPVTATIDNYRGGMGEFCSRNEVKFAQNFSAMPLGRNAQGPAAVGTAAATSGLTGGSATLIGAGTGAAAIGGSFLVGFGTTASIQCALFGGSAVSAGGSGG